MAGPWILADAALRLSVYVSALLAAGILAHVAVGVVEDAARRRWSSRAAMLALIALQFAIGRAVLAGFALGGGALTSEALRLAISVHGPTVVCWGAAMALAFIARDVRPRVLSGLAAGLIATGFAVTGHAQGLDSPGLAPLAVGIHMLLAAFWAGAPATLWPAKSLPREAIVARARRFSQIALWSTPALIALGAVLSLLIAGGWAQLVSSAYGLLMGIKLASAVAALSLGALNKLRITAALETGHPQATHWLRWTLSIEALLFFAALIALTIATSIVGPPHAM